MKKNLIRVILPSVTLILILLFLSSNDETDDNSFKRARLLMGTMVEITIYDNKNSDLSHEAVTEAFNEIERLENLLSRRKKGSDIWNINNHPKEAIVVSEETLAVVEAGLHFYKISEGRFDITVGKLIDLWNFEEEKEKVNIPSKVEINNVINTDGAKKIIVDRVEKTISSMSDSHLDLGGIAKGYIIDKAAEKLLQRNIKNFIINAGGDMAIKGKKGDKPWRIGLQHPRNPDSVIAHVDIHKEFTSIVTSGDYERNFLFEGKRYHHIINPLTGYPAEGLVSVTIEASDTQSADALSTAVFVLGKEKGLKLIESLGGVEGILVDHNLKVYVTEGLKNSAVLR